MQWGKRGPGSPSRRRREAFRPSSESLEGRQLLTTFDLTTTQTAPLGVEMIGKANGNTAGYTVTDVGNVTGSGFDSFVVSAPGLPQAGIGGNPDFAAAQESAAYLVFGSKQVNASNAADWLTLAKGTTNGISADLTGGQRAGDLGELGTIGVAPLTAQTNPTVSQPQPPMTATHVYGFNYDGVTLVTGLNPATGLGRNSALGFSVAALGDVNGDGFDDFAISAPNDAGGGKVFIVFGGNQLTTLTTTTKTIDLEPTPGTTSTTTPTKVISLSIPNGAPGTNVGYSVAGLGNYFNNANFIHDLAIGVPGMTVGSNANAGAVYAISGSYFAGLGAGTNVDLTTVGTSTNTSAGIKYTGINANDRTGASVATAGNFDGTSGTGGRAVNSLLIGAPGTFGGGSAYLVYGVQSFLPNSQIGTTQPLNTLGKPAQVNPVTNPLQGIVFQDLAAGDRFGFAVASAGDFNADGVGDIIIGAPGYSTSTGFAAVIYGQSGTTTTRLNGTFNVSATATSTAYKSVSLIGEGINNFAGYSLAPSGHIQIGTAPTGAAPAVDVLIGAPGFQSNLGKVYLVPGTGAGGTALTGSQMLSTIDAAPLSGNSFVPSGLTDPAVVPVGLGTSVSARNPVVDPNTLGTTVDNDSVPDLFFGAPFSTLLDPFTKSATRISAGATYVVQGGLIGTSSGGGGGGGGGGGSTSAVVPSAFGLLTPRIFTGDNAGLPYPPVSSLEHLGSYQPLPVQIAYQQYQVQPGFLAREELYHHPGRSRKNVHQFPAGTILNVAAIGHSENKYSKVNTLRPGIFTRGKLKLGKAVTFTHKGKVIPRSQQTQTFQG